MFKNREKKKQHEMLLRITAHVSQMRGEKRGGGVGAWGKVRFKFPIANEGS